MKAADRVLRREEHEPFDIMPDVSHSAAASAVHLAIVAAYVIGDSGWALEQAVEHTDEFIKHIKAVRNTGDQQRIALLNAIARSLLTDAEDTYPRKKRDT